METMRPGLSIIWLSRGIQELRVALMTLTRFVIVLVISFGCGVLHSLSGQTVSPNASQTRSIKKVPGATVSGRVTVQGKGKGGVFVGIRPAEFGPQTAPAVKAVTDADGIYHLTDVPPGSYQILPMAPAYVVTDYTAFGGQGKGLILSEGERVDGIDFSIVRGAVVTGKVTQSDGKPVIDEPVYLVAAVQNNQRGPRFTDPSRFMTDDRGVYRMYGITPGRYKISVGASEETFAPNRNRPSFVRVFYPSVTSFDEAKVVELSEGSEATNIDITVGQSLQNFAASGVVLDGETNQPAPNVRLGLQKILENNQSFMGASALSNERGEFRLENITPGTYSLTMMPRPDSEIRIDPLRIEVVDQDVSGLNVKTLKGAALSGFVVLEGNQSKEAYARLAKLGIFASVRSGDGPFLGGGGRVATIGADGSFRLGGLAAGTANFGLSSPTSGSQSGFMISRIEREGVVQPRSGMEIKAGEQITGVRIVITYGNGIVRGSVKLDTGPLPAGIQLMVRLIKTGDTLHGIRPQNIDARGYFVFEGVPAGTYEVNLMGSIPQLRGRQPAVKQSVTVTDGATTEVQLVINTEPDTPPTP